MDRNSTTDEEILAMIRRKETFDEGFKRLMWRYGRGLYWHIRHIVARHDDAEDAFQETSIKIYEKIDSLNGDARQMKGWIYKVATNEALQQLRKRTTLFQSIDSLSEQLVETMRADAEADAEKAELLFEEATLRLPTQQRIVFNMRYRDELTYEQMSEATGKSISNLKTTYHYAYEKIKNYIKEHAE
jgi:RNA polymerase sigma-70 factor (ECF subfamily)